MGGRVEHFSDKDQVVAVTTTPNGFQTSGASVNVDWQPESSALITNDVRSFFSKDAAFPKPTGANPSDTLFVTSLAPTF